MKSFEAFAKAWIKEVPSRKTRYGAKLADMTEESVAVIRRAYDHQHGLELRDARMVAADKRAEAEAEKKVAAQTARREALEKLADRIRAALGANTKHSALSDSTYIEAEGRKIRISDHPLPPTYGALNGYADIEVAVGYRDGDSHVSLMSFDDDAIDGAVAQIIERVKN